MSAVSRVLVVGGGIGGLCTAIALRRIGIDVDVVEINPDWDVYGVGIIQPGNALRALKDLGLGEQALAQGYPMLGVRVHRADGEMQFEINEEPLVAGYPPMNGITRPRLHKILTTAVLDSGAQVRTGVTVSDLVQRAGGVDASFTDGTSGFYDLVVGADGIYSKTRAMVFGEDLRAVPNGQIAWRYNLPRREDLQHLWMFEGDHNKAGLVPIGPDLMYLLQIGTAPENWSGRFPDGDLADEFRARLAEYGGAIAQASAQVVDSSAVVMRAVETILVPAPWYRGRVVLVGDAAHATSPHAGQGAAQAIEDAVVLSEELARDVDVTVALDAFMVRRYERCKMVLERSLQIGEWEMHPAPDMNPAMPALIAMDTNAPL
jgi:2-polyprenyl-6-methoxyphenol hydroxylase-like FAD-dependent oxidoreductase